MKAWRGATLSALALSTSGMVVAQQRQAAPGPEQAEALAARLVGRMTTDEKLGQLLNTAPAIARLDVPAYNWWTESLHGALGPVPTTNFPEPVGLAATFDDALVGRAAQAVSAEVRGLHALARTTGRMGRIGTGSTLGRPISTSSATRVGGGDRRPMARIRS